MKRTTTLIAALLMIIGTAVASNPTDGAKKTEASVSLVSWKDKVQRLTYTSNEAGKVIVRIKDDNGKTLFRKTVQNQKGFAIPLNFDEEGYGTYELIIADKNGTYSREFSVTPISKPCTCD